MTSLIDAAGIDWTPYWTWMLISTRLAGLLSIVPGIGTNQIPAFARTAAGLVIAIALVAGGMAAKVPETLAEGGLMVITEFALGFVLGFIPSIIIGGIAVAGQVTTGAIGLGQANMMDPSLGGQVAVLARIQSLVSGVIFLVIDGHHAVIRAAAGTFGDIGVGMFRPTEAVAMLLIERFAHAFELAVAVSAPILVTVLVANFVLGLITRFVSQVNIFIISLPLTIMMGLYITVYTTSGFVDHLLVEFLNLEQVYQALAEL